jgi:hypothetical protein
MTNSVCFYRVKAMLVVTDTELGDLLARRKIEQKSKE